MAKGADFWNERFDADPYAYGEQPNTFVRTAAGRWLEARSSILDLGAGEGRNAVFLAGEGHRVTAADFSAVGLKKTTRLAERRCVDIATRHVDVRSWSPDRTWDAVVTTFLHLPADQRGDLYNLLQGLVRPGGRIVSEWFRPEQRTDGYESGGPPDVTMMVTVDELRSHFSERGILHLETAHPVLDEGPHHQGPAATVRLVWERPAGTNPESGPERYPGSPRAS